MVWTIQEDLIIDIAACREKNRSAYIACDIDVCTLADQRQRLITQEIADGLLERTACPLEHDLKSDMLTNEPVCVELS